MANKAEVDACEAFWSVEREACARIADRRGYMARLRYVDNEGYASIAEADLGDAALRD